MAEEKTFTGSKKATGYIVAVLSLVGSYYAGVLMQLSPEVMKDLTTKITAVAITYLGGQSAVDMLKKLVEALASIKGLLNNTPAEPASPGEPK